MKKVNIIIIFLVLLLLSSSRVFALDGQDEKTLAIIVDELDFEVIEEIFKDNNYGIGFINIKTRKPYGTESLYLSLATGRKLGLKEGLYKGLYKDSQGIIHLENYEKIYRNLKKNYGNIKLNFLGDQLEAGGVSFIGENSSALIGVNSRGEISSGELVMDYNLDWLIAKTEEHLSSSNTLILAYGIGETKHRVDLLKKYIEAFKDYNLILVPEKVAPSMKKLVNKNLVPVLYVREAGKGLLKTPSTQREGLITLGDLHRELTFLARGEEGGIEIVAKEDQLSESRAFYKRTTNLIFLAIIFHGLVYFFQVYNSHQLRRNRLGRIEEINLYNNFILTSIFLSLLMGFSSLHINLFLYLLIIFLVAYLVTVFLAEKDIDFLALLSSLSYGITLFAIFLYPELIYNSYIGFNNLFYGARYYGFNNGIMGVLLITSIISYYSVEKLIEIKLIKNIVCFLYFFLNVLALSVNYGANTGGFITSVILFLLMVYINILEKDFTTKNVIILLLIGLLIFTFNMYLDYYSQNKSHAIGFLIRIGNFGLDEFVDMFKSKFKELVKWTLLPPFSIVIISQLLSLRKLREIIVDYKIQYKLILLISLIAFILNDTGMITFIYMTHYLISLIIYENMEDLKL